MARKNGNGKDVLHQLVATIENLRGDVATHGVFIEGLQDNQGQMHKAMGEMQRAMGQMGAAMQTLAGAVEELTSTVDRQGSMIDKIQANNERQQQTLSRLAKLLHESH